MLKSYSHSSTCRILHQKVPCAVQHLLILCLLCACAATVVFAQETSARPGWKLYWSDEFDGNSLDESVWSIEQLDPPHNEELQFYTKTHDQKDSNIWVKGGVLAIEAREQKATGRRREYAYTSGRIKTQGKKEFQYGRMEARIKLPSGNGIWPAFWMLGNTLRTEGWPRAGEIDIMEAKGRLPHYASGAIHRGPRGRNKIFSKTYTLEGKSLFDDFHVFAIEWDEKQIKWFVDDDNFMTAKKADETNPVYWPFDKPFFFILNVAVGGWFDKGEDNVNQTPEEGDLPTRMLVDYVRVYKPVE